MTLARTRKGAASGGSRAARRGPLRPGRPSRPGLLAAVCRHRVFAGLLAIGIALRGIAMLGYPSALWFDDSFEYLGVALRPYPYPIRPNGYPFLLSLLRPFHSFALVVLIQHLLGLATGVMIYALLRRGIGVSPAGGSSDDRGRLPAWGAALATAPVLLDANVIALEHSLLSDTLFTFLLTTAVIVVLWRREVTTGVGVAAGLLVAAGTLTRSAGLPLLAIVLAYLLLRRAPWRAIVATAVTGIVPLVAYAFWFHSHHGTYGLTSSSGVILWSRTAPFADCRISRPPPSEAGLCPRRPPDQRPEPTAFLWTADSPLTRSGGRPVTTRADRFATATNKRAGSLARRTILAQPGDYLAAVGLDLGRTFAWGIKTHTEPVIYNMYEFPDLEGTLPRRAEIPGGTFHGDLRAYEADGPGVIRTRIEEPYAAILRTYQRFGWLPGFGLGILLLVGLSGVVRPRRAPRRGTRRAVDAPAGQRPAESIGRLAALLPWAIAMSLLVVPVVVAGFGPRYRLAAVPMVCLTAAIALAHRRRAGYGGPVADVRQPEPRQARPDEPAQREPAGSPRTRTGQDS